MGWESGSEIEVTPLGDAQNLWNNPQELIDLWDSLESKSRHEKLIADLVGPAGSVADLGCGAGRFSRALDFTSYIGYDSSPEMIVAASARNKKVDFACVDILRFVSDYSYDTIISIDVAYHLEDPLRALRTIINLWRAKRYFFTLLVGKKETLLNSQVVSEEEFNGFIKTLNIKVLHTEEVLGESFWWVVCGVEGKDVL